jgi:UDP-glucuronate decarboxylase
MSLMDISALSAPTPRPYPLGPRSHGVTLVPGGAGFLGSHLCTRLVEAGQRVIALDNLSTGRVQNVAHLENTGLFTLIEHDVINPITIKGPVDSIYNLACAASPPRYQLDPVHTFRTSVDGARNLLDLAREKGARILQASTSEVYGDPELTPQPETYCGLVNTVGPRACYDEGKRGAETLFYEYARQMGVDTRIARIFNTYGPRMDAQDGRVVSNFVVQALTGEDITIYGTGQQTRSFCYVDDLIDGLIRLMELGSAFNSPVNLGNPKEFQVLELADLVLAKTRSASKLRFMDALQDDPKQRRPDITRAQTLLGWQPTVALHDGLDQMIGHFSGELGLQPAVALS